MASRSLSFKVKGALTTNIPLADKPAVSAENRKRIVEMLMARLDWLYNYKGQT
jgi:hypothetical protein